jgi:hypothetical protein
VSQARDPHNRESQGSYSPLAIPCGARGGRFRSAWRFLVQLESGLLEVLDYSLGELAPGIIRRVFAKEPAEQLPAAGQGEANREHQLVAERSMIHGHVLVLFEAWCLAPHDAVKT